MTEENDGGKSGPLPNNVVVNFAGISHRFQSS